MNNTQEKLTGEQIIEILKNSEISVYSFAMEDLDIDYEFSKEALEADKKKDEWLENNPNPGYGKEGYDKWLKEYKSYPSKYEVKENEWKKANNIPNWKEVEQYGGESMGDTWYSVKYFPDHDVYIRVDGWYQSHNGTDFNGWEDCSVVKPVEKTITVYE